MAIPKRIVRQDETTHRNQRINEVQIRAIIPLIGIDEDEIVWVIGLVAGKPFLSIGDDEVNLRTQRRAGEVTPDDGLQFIIMLNGIEHAVFRQPFRQTKGRIAGEGAELQNAMRLNHMAEHRERAPLHVPAEHMRVQYMNVRIARNGLQNVIFRRRMDGNILFKCHNVTKIAAKLQKFLHISKIYCIFAANFNLFIEGMEKIDELDRKILKIITQSARIPFRDVAEQCGVSRAAVHQRVQKMFDNGTITGSSYHVQPKSLGYQLCVYIGIKMEKASMYNQVIAALEQIPEIVEAQYTLGEFGLLIKVYAHDNEHLLSLLNNKIQIIPGVADTTTLTTLAQPIYRQLPIEV